VGIKGVCKSCGETYNKKGEYLGKEVKCKTCGERFTLEVCRTEFGESTDLESAKSDLEDKNTPFFRPITCCLITLIILLAIGIASLLVFRNVGSSQPKPSPAKDTFDYDSASVEDLIDRLEDRDGSINLKALGAFEKHGDDAAVELYREIRSGYRSEEAVAKIVVALVVMLNHSDRAIYMIRELVYAQDNDVIKGMIFAALAGRGEKSVPLLIEFVRSRDPIVRRAAAEALGSIGAEAKAALPALYTMARGERWEDARRSARTAIRRINSASPRKRIVDLMDDPSFIISNLFSVENVSLHGIRLGDSAEKIPVDQIDERNKQGWIFLKSDARYHILNGVVAQFAIPPALVKRTGLNCASDAYYTFGKPDRTENLVNRYGKVTTKVFYYFEKGIIVHWQAPESIHHISIASNARRIWELSKRYN
jgi:hypothetical protein